MEEPLNSWRPFEAFVAIFFSRPEQVPHRLRPGISAHTTLPRQWRWMATLDGDFIPLSFFLCFWLDNNQPTRAIAAALRTPPLERRLAISMRGAFAPPGE